MRTPGMGRLLARLLALGLALLILVVVPSAAHAGGPWVVKDAAGKKIGHARTNGGQYSSARHKVYGPRWIEKAWVQYERMYAWTTHAVTTTGPQPSAYVQRVDGWHMGPAKSGNWSGRIRKSGGRWIVLLEVNGAWKKRGSVSSACPVWLAGGAVYILLGDRWW